MERAAIVYWDLLHGKDKPVAGSTCAFPAQSAFLSNLCYKKRLVY